MTTLTSITTNEEQESHGLYCADLECWCHNDSNYHELVTHPEVTADEIETAYSFLEIARAAA